MEHNVSADDLFAPGFGWIVAEVPSELVGALSITYTVVGVITNDPWL